MTAATEASEAASRVVALTSELEAAHKYAVQLFLWMAPQCTPLPDLRGVLTQIDNAITVIPKLKARAEAAESALAEDHRTRETRT